MLATCTHSLIYKKSKLPTKENKDKPMNYLSAALALPEHKGGAGDGAFSDGPG